MGGALDALSIAVGSGGVATVLVRSLFAWMGTRRRSSTLHLTVKRADGTEIKLKLDDIQDPDATIGELSKFIAEE
ncbi:hypothetical protein GCM10029964_126580 [Kibdelosporangium lantanae]